jgi:hypothetical protein
MFTRDGSVRGLCLRYSEGYQVNHTHEGVPMNMKLNGLLLGIALTAGSLCAYAAEGHVAEALKHAEAAVKAADGKTIAEHAETAKTHAKIAEEHLDAGIKSLDSAIEHGKLGHADLAKKSAEEAVTHLKAAQ